LKRKESGKIVEFVFSQLLTGLPFLGKSENVGEFGKGKQKVRKKPQSQVNVRDFV